MERVCWPLEKRAWQETARTHSIGPRPLSLLKAAIFSWPMDMAAIPTRGSSNFRRTASLSRRGEEKGRPQESSLNFTLLRSIPQGGYMSATRQQPHPDLRPGRQISRGVEAVRPSERDLH